MIEAIRRLLPHCEIHRITENNARDAADIYRTNSAYFSLFNDTSSDDPAPHSTSWADEAALLANIVNDITQVPPGFNREQKLFAGCWLDGSMVAVLDLLQGYPDAACCWIGLLLVHRDVQGTGMGRAITNAVTTAARMAGYKAVRLGVLQQNHQALRFWERNGFRQIDVRKLTLQHGQCLTIIVLENTDGLS